MVEADNIFRELAGSQVLVTGGAGFIGCNVANRLLEAGAVVTVVDDLSAGHERNLRSGVKIIRGTVTDLPLIRELARDASIVIHLAARSIASSTENPYADFQVNIGGTLNVLMAVRGTAVRRVVYASSSSVYGNAPSLPANEDDVPDVLSPYSVSKLAGEHYCEAFYETYGVKTVALRYSNVYGPAQRPENPYTGVVSKFLSSVMSRHPLLIFGDGKQTRDYTFVDDVVEATLRAAIIPKAEGRVYNVGTGCETSVNTLAAMTARIGGISLCCKRVEGRKIDNIHRRAVNIQKIRRELGWAPKVLLEEGLRRTYEWMERECASQLIRHPELPGGPRDWGHGLSNYDS